MTSQIFRAITGACLVAMTGCMTVPTGFVWGDNTSQWANDGDCDDPRFTGPMAHSLLLPEDAYRDATDCRILFENGDVYLRPNYQPGVTYENPGYIGQN